MSSDETKKIPFSQRESPHFVADSEPNAYTEARLNGDYKLFCEGREGYLENLDKLGKQKQLFQLYEWGEVNDAGQAFEWWYGKKWEGWSNEECTEAIDNALNEEDKAQLRLLMRRRTT